MAGGCVTASSRYACIPTVLLRSETTHDCSERTVTKYAARTAVPVDRSKAEIERILQRWGADQFAYGWQHGGAMIGFRIDNRQVRLTLPLPLPTEFMAGLMLPDGRTVGEWATPQIEAAYARGLMPSSLPGLPAPKQDNVVEMQR